MADSAARMVAWRRERIQRSSKVSSFEFRVSGEAAASLRFDRMNLLAFQILLAKLRPMSNLGEVLTPVLGSLTTGMRMSWVSVAMLARVKRRASAPWEP